MIGQVGSWGHMRALLHRWPFRFGVEIVFTWSFESCAGFEVQDQAECRIAIKVVTMEPFASQETQPFVQPERGSVCDFGFEDNLDQSQYTIIRV
jgi:hypothetical protein